MFYHVIWKTSSDILETTSSRKLLVRICQTARCHITEDCSFHYEEQYILLTNSKG